MEKIARNRRRDDEVTVELAGQGWRVIRIPRASPANEISRHRDRRLAIRRRPDGWSA